MAFKYLCSLFIVIAYTNVLLKVQSLVLRYPYVSLQLSPVQPIYKIEPIACLRNSYLIPQVSTFTSYPAQVNSYVNNVNTVNSVSSSQYIGPPRYSVNDISYVQNSIISTGRVQYPVSNANILQYPNRFSSPSQSTNFVNNVNPVEEYSGCTNNYQISENGNYPSFVSPSPVYTQNAPQLTQSQVSPAVAPSKRSSPIQLESVPVVSTIQATMQNQASLIQNTSSENNYGSIESIILDPINNK